MDQPARDFRMDAPAPDGTMKRDDETRQENEIVDNIPAVTVIMDVVSRCATR